MLAEETRQEPFLPMMSHEQKENDPVDEMSSIDKVNVCKNVKSYKIMFKKDDSAAEKRGGDVKRRSKTRFNNFCDPFLMICTCCRSRSRSKVPEEKRRNIRRLILQFLQFFRPGKVEPFQI